MSRGIFCFRLIYVFIIAAVFYITVPSSFAAESGSIKVMVLDKVTNEPLIGAKVAVLNTSLEGSANIDGIVTIGGVPAGQQNLRISYIGYETITVELIISENGILDQKFLLEPLAMQGIEVTIYGGEMRGQLAAINAQLMANNIVDIMSSEKMKELPDANIAESVGRLPGVTLQRDAGEANAVIVRGLSPKYNKVTIEGIALNSTNYFDRAIDLSLIGDEMVKWVEVSKTLRPDMDADALGGTVNLTLKTAQEGLHYNVRTTGGYTKLNDSYKNYKLAGNVSDRFLDDKFGVILQGSLEQKMLPSDQFNALYTQPVGASKVVGIDTISFYSMSASSATLKQTKTIRNRYSASVILDYASDIVDVKFYNIYNQKKDSSITNSNNMTFFSQYLYQIFVNVTKTEQRMHSLQFLFKLGKTELPLSISYTRGDVNAPNDQQIDIWGDYHGLIEFVPYPTNFKQPAELMAYMGVQQPENSLLQQLYIIQNTLVDQTYDVKADWKVPFRLSDDVSGILSVGGKYHSVDRTSNCNLYGLYIDLGSDLSVRNYLTEYLTAAYPGFSTNPFPLTHKGIEAHNFVDPNYKGGSILGYPIGQQYDVYKLLSINNHSWSIHGLQTANNLYLLNGVTSFSNDYTDKESTIASYIMAEFNIGTDLSIIPGIRFQEDKTDISAYNILLDRLSPEGTSVPPRLNRSKSDNQDWLPSINFKYKAAENIQILGAAYRSVSLPGYGDISPMAIFDPYNGISLANGNRIQILCGNPLLKPSTSTNFDLGISVFSNNIGLFTVNLFYKEMTDLIYSMNNYQPFLTTPIVGGPSDLMSRLPGEDYFDTTFTQLATGSLITNIPMNNPEKAFLRGIEISWQTRLWYLPWVLSGIVLDLNASFMSSSQLYPYFEKVQTGGTKIRPIYSMFYRTRSGQLQDQPKAIYNSILGWDYKGFSSRFSFRYQQTTLTSLDTRYDVRDSYYDNMLLIDISMKQQILNNLSMFADVKNINNHIDEYYLNYYNGDNGTSGRLPTGVQEYGMRAQVGFSYNY